MVSVISALGALVKYFQSSGNEYLLRLKGVDVRRQLQRQLPWQGSAVAERDLTLDNARVRLDEGSDEVIVGLALALAPAASVASGSGDCANLAVTGVLEFSAGVDYCAREGAFYLCAVDLHHCEIPKLPASEASTVRAAVLAEVEALCASASIHTLAGMGQHSDGSGAGVSDSARAFRTLRLSDVAVVNRCLILALD
ncbi:MAG: hypothetical protein Hals2KO_04500 [Halioglobus sp.]